MKTVDLLIVIRCHAFTDFVIDSLQAVEYYTSSNSVAVVLAVDGSSKSFGKKMVELLGEDRVFVSATHWGWGAGLFSLLLQSIQYFRYRYEFNHFQTIDYDTLYINHGADTAIMSKINSPKVGLLGVHMKRNDHWRTIYGKEKLKFERTFGAPPPTYIAGEGCQGGCMTLSAALLHEMQLRRMFEAPFLVAKDHTTIADDHLLPIFVRMCGLEIVDISEIAYCHWNIPRDPRGIETMGYKLFHPTKLKARNKDRSTEIEVRNYFRRLRGAPDLLR